MLDVKNPWQDAEFGATSWRWNFDTAALGYDQQEMCASWK